MFENLRNNSGNFMQNIMSMSKLDESGMSMLENEIGKEKVAGIKDEIQRISSNGDMTEEMVSETAERFGVPEKIVQLIASYYQNL